MSVLFQEFSKVLVALFQSSLNREEVVFRNDEMLTFQNQRTLKETSFIVDKKWTDELNEKETELPPVCIVKENNRTLVIVKVEDAFLFAKLNRPKPTEIIIQHRKVEKGVLGPLETANQQRILEKWCKLLLTEINEYRLLTITNALHVEFEPRL